MELILYCPLWGMEGSKLEDSLAQIKKAGYDGAEIAIDPDVDNIKSIHEAFNNIGLRMVVQHPFAKGETFSAYRQDFLTKLMALTSLRPDKINCHTGRDFFSIAENLALVVEAKKISETTDISILHEIHRGRFTYSPALIDEYLEYGFNIPFTADFSHWCVVSESLLENFEPILQKVFPYCHHIHARIGDAQSPQVNHPGSGENRYAVERHTQWWHAIYLEHKKRNQKELSITCEFGPIPYMSLLPFTDQPIANQWDINLFMKDYLTKTFNQWETQNVIF